MRKPDLAKAKKKIEDWNSSYPVGTKVIVKRDSGEKMETVTQSEAELLGGHTPVVWVRGIRGAYALSRVTPVG